MDSHEMEERAFITGLGFGLFGEKLDRQIYELTNSLKELNPESIFVKEFAEGVKIGKQKRKDRNDRLAAVQKRQDELKGLSKESKSKDKNLGR